MSQRRKLYQERLEVYLVNIIMAYRPLWLVLGLLVMAFGIALLNTSLLAAVVLDLAGIWMLLMVWTYKAVLYTARGLAWLGSIWERDI